MFYPLFLSIGGLPSFNVTFPRPNVSPRVDGLGAALVAADTPGRTEKMGMWTTVIHEDL